MTLYAPNYRTDYIGENINIIVDGQTKSYFIEPRPNVFTPTNSPSAIVVGNGLTKLYKENQMLLNTNSKRSIEGYKHVYACNMSTQDDFAYDYYVVKNSAFLARLEDTKLNQIYLPYDVFFNYKDTCNLLPYLSYFDAGSSAAYLAAFDGHKKIFLMGFDGDLGLGYQTVYDGSYLYTDNTNFDWAKWETYMLNIMSVYRDVEFYRIQLDGQCAPSSWKALPNFRDVTAREAVMLGDF
jgi:hypothetical protein